MVTLRCTRKLLKRLQGKSAAVESLATSRLGDWHASLLYLTGGQVILVVNDRTLLPVLVPASPGSRFIARFRSALSEVLGRLGIDPLVIEKELDSMDEVQLSSTRSRVVAGSMNDFAFLLGARREWEGDLTDEALRLAGIGETTPCRPRRVHY